MYMKYFFTRWSDKFRNISFKYTKRDSLSELRANFIPRLYTMGVKTFL